MQKELNPFGTLQEALDFVREIIDSSPYLVGKEITYTIQPHNNIYRIFVNRERLLWIRKN